MYKLFIITSTLNGQYSLQSEITAQPLVVPRFLQTARKTLILARAVPLKNLTPYEQNYGKRARRPRRQHIVVNTFQIT
jgi:hypothetical protein